jgi:energy-converting hydrogenase Eha subunit C
LLKLSEAQGKSLSRIAHLRTLSLLIAGLGYADVAQCCNLSNAEAPHYMRLARQIGQRVYFGDKQMLDRLNTVVMLALVGSGLAACVVGAFAYDVARLLSFW